MLSDEERAALERWYSQPSVVDEARRLVDAGEFHRLEEHVHRIFLLPIGRHDELPDYMRSSKGEPLFPTNLNPTVDEEIWQDAIEVGWEVVHEKLGLSRADIHRRIAGTEQADWDSFLESVEKRKKERGEG